MSGGAGELVLRLLRASPRTDDNVPPRVIEPPPPLLLTLLVPAPNPLADEVVVNVDPDSDAPPPAPAVALPDESM